jgi:hypothetical protein
LNLDLFCQLEGEGKERKRRRRKVKGNEGGRRRTNAPQENCSKREKKETEIRENEEGRRRINASLSLLFPFFLPIWKERKTVGPGFLSPRFHATKQGSILSSR